MKFWKTIIIPSVMAMIVILPLATACGTAAAVQPAPTPQQVAVVRGDLVTQVTGSGKVAIPNYANLSFGSGGKLVTLNVAEGDRVTKGALLAQLDTASLEVALAQARVALDQAQLGQIQAQTSLNTAQFNLDKTRGYADLRDAMTNLQWEIKIASTNMLQAQNANDSGGAGYWRQVVTADQMSLAQKTRDLATLLSNAEYTGTVTYDIMGDKYDNLTANDMKAKQLAVSAAQKTLDLTKDNMAQAQKNIDLVQKQITDATIIAPFSGIAATVTPRVGDIIPAPTVSPQVIIYLVDTTDLEVDANIDELDIPAVLAGEGALISVDALPGISVDGKVISVSTVPNPLLASAGGTMYVVKIGFTAPSGATIKSGMNTSVRIVTNEHKNALLVPSLAVRKDGQGKAYVQTLEGPQSISAGISDGTRTEVLRGLKDGDSVITDKIDGKWSLSVR